MDNMSLRKALSEEILRCAVMECHDVEMAALPTDEELEGFNHVFSQRHEKRMRALFRRERRKELLITFGHISKRIAVVVVVVFAALSVLLLSNAQVRAAIKKTIIEWYSQYTRFSFAKADTLEAFEEWQLTYLPEGFKETDAFPLAALRVVEFENPNGGCIRLEYAQTDDGLVFAVDNEHSEFEILEIDAVEYNVFRSTTADRMSKIIWQKSGYSFFIQSTADADELMLMAASAIKK